MNLLWYSIGISSSMLLLMLAIPKVVESVSPDAWVVVFVVGGIGLIVSTVGMAGADR
jgi:hypothetical protein